MKLEVAFRTMDAKTKKKLPFAINRSDARSLAAQVTDGLRTAIVDGYYAPGDTIPTSRDLAPMLGVSRIVTIAALERLAAEGYIVSRPRIGSVVRDRAAKQWRGHVVTVHPQGDIGYFSAVFAEEIRPALHHAGSPTSSSPTARLSRREPSACSASTTRRPPRTSRPRAARAAFGPSSFCAGTASCATPHRRSGTPASPCGPLR